MLLCKNKCELVPLPASGFLKLFIISSQSVQVAETIRKKEVSEASSNFQKQAEIKEQEREMRTKIASANATAVEGENKAKEIIASSNANLKIKEVEANLLSEGKEKEAHGKVKKKV